MTRITLILIHYIRVIRVIRGFDVQEFIMPFVRFMVPSFFRL